MGDGYALREVQTIRRLLLTTVPLFSALIKQPTLGKAFHDRESE
jgi:hypothetical protein